MSQVPAMPALLAGLWILIGVFCIWLGAHKLWGQNAGVLAVGVALLALVFRFA
jgi:hypothetical protein